MRIKRFVLAATVCSGWILFGCKGRETPGTVAQESAPPPSSTETAAPVAVEATAAPTEVARSTVPEAPTSAAAVRQSAPTVPAKSAPKPSPSRRPQQTAAMAVATREAATPIPPASPASVPVAPTQAAKASKVTDPGGPIAVAATKSGLTRIGAEKCKVCHKVQFASWAETAHARRTPPLDCESCHGPGSEYKALAIMKDPEKARAAGLVIPTATFCAKCHTSGWKDDMLKKAHAHKAGA